MDRRLALKMTTTAMVGTIVGADFFLSGCKREAVPLEAISTDEIALLDEIGEAILPETPDSPGAKAAHIGAFMKAIVTDCYSPEEQEAFLKGITDLRQRVRAEHQQDFERLTDTDKLAFLTKLDAEASAWPQDGIPHYFTMIKQLTVWGYFTSEPGVTKALRYNPIPGRYEGCIPYAEGEKAWAT